MIYLGIDLHTRNMTICAVSSNGTKIGEWKLSNCEDQLDKLINQFEQPVKAVVEATSSWIRVDCLIHLPTRRLSGAETMFL